ncbi:MAG: hypothetical protein HC901_04200, partial [Bdellovibrionaceae bacterium]|nr:hypothetical protein [Pseudobdellovibrionaceae bacterium]
MLVLQPAMMAAKTEIHEYYDRARVISAKIANPDGLANADVVMLLRQMRRYQNRIAKLAARAYSVDNPRSAASASNRASEEANSSSASRMSSPEMYPLSAAALESFKAASNSSSTDRGLALITTILTPSGNNRQQIPALAMGGADLLDQGSAFSLEQDRAAAPTSREVYANRMLTRLLDLERKGQTLTALQQEQKESAERILGQSFAFEGEDLGDRPVGRQVPLPVSEPLIGTDEQAGGELFDQPTASTGFFRMDSPQGMLFMGAADTLAKVEMQLPVLSSNGKLNTNGTTEQVWERLGRAYDALPASVIDRAGLLIHLRHTAQGTEDDLFYHLTTQDAGGEILDRIRGAWLSLIPRTLEQARIKLDAGKTTAGRQRWFYIGRYDTGYRHLVLVQEGTAISQGVIGPALWTQFSQRVGKENRHSLMKAVPVGTPMVSGTDAPGPRRIEEARPNSTSSTDQDEGFSPSTPNNTAQGENGQRLFMARLQDTGTLDLFADYGARVEAEALAQAVAESPVATEDVAEVLKPEVTGKEAEAITAAVEDVRESGISKPRVTPQVPTAPVAKGPREIKSKENSTDIRMPDGAVVTYAYPRDEALQMAREDAGLPTEPEGISKDRAEQMQLFMGSDGLIRRTDYESPIARDPDEAFEEARGAFDPADFTTWPIFEKAAARLEENPPENPTEMQENGEIPDTDQLKRLSRYAKAEGEDAVAELALKLGLELRRMQRQGPSSLRDARMWAYDYFQDENRQTVYHVWVDPEPGIDMENPATWPGDLQAEYTAWADAQEDDTIADSDAIEANPQWIEELKRRRDQALATLPEWEQEQIRAVRGWPSPTQAQNEFRAKVQSAIEPAPDDAKGSAISPDRAAQMRLFMGAGMREDMRAQIEFLNAAARALGLPDLEALPQETFLMLASEWGERRRAEGREWDAVAAGGVVASNATVLPAGMLAMGGYHGTPHEIDPREGFRLDKIGTGEGAQAYGHGLYFAGSDETADYYRRSLSGKPDIRFDGTRVPITGETPESMVAAKLSYLAAAHRNLGHPIDPIKIMDEVGKSIDGLINAALETKRP